MPAPAERLAFTTSRLLEYLSVKELTLQIGHEVGLWPLALLKELVDNSLDACEAAGVAPAVQVEVGADSFAVEDNGPGIPPEVVRAALDFGTRTSSNSRYVGPTRGQLGNALKAVVAAPGVLFPGRGAGVAITARGIEHRIVIGRDAIAQQPVIGHQEAAVRKPGTSVRLDWPAVASCDWTLEGGCFYTEPGIDLLSAFSLYNPHATFGLNGDTLLGPTPLRKWRASDRTSAHWYDEAQLADLIAAHIHRGRQGLPAARSLREFVTGFAGLTGSMKAPAVLERAGLAGKSLEDLASSGTVSASAAGRLLRAMKEGAPAPGPEKLGRLGRESIARTLSYYSQAASAEAVRYKRLDGVCAGRPFVVEVAFAVQPDGGRRMLRTGINWTPSLSVAIPELFDHLAEVMIEEDDPVSVVVHVVTPLVAYTDRGKSHAALHPRIVDAVEQALAAATAPWQKEKRKVARKQRIAANALDRLTGRSPGDSLKDAAWQVMIDAHAHVTGGNVGAPAQARQVMYAARKLMQKLVGARTWKKSSTFTQHHLPDFIEAHPKLTAGWNVVYDDRGELIEPHGGESVGLGTLDVRGYVGQLDPLGPLDRYAFVLLVEKEGFRHLIEHARIADRFDVALAWTKGMSTTAARELVDELSGRGVTTLVLHDFDYAGLGIYYTLCHDGRRYRFRNTPRVVDVGLRFDDVQSLGLEGEVVEYANKTKDPRELLASRGVPQQERDYLVQEYLGARLYRGRRVELNELTNEQFIAFVEAKLVAAGVQKVVPDEQRLQQEYADRWRHQQVEEAVREARRRAEEQVDKLAVPTPADLAVLVRRGIDGTPLDWRQALDGLVSGAGRT